MEGPQAGQVTVGEFEAACGIKLALALSVEAEVVSIEVGFLHRSHVALSLKYQTTYRRLRLEIATVDMQCSIALTD